MGNDFAGFVDACGNNYVSLGFNKLKGEVWSVRGDTLNLGFTPKNNNFIEKLVSERNVKLIVSYLYFYIAAQL